MASSAIDGGTILVTGASSGIGMAIARLVAPRAKTIVLVARRVDRLEELKRALLEHRSSLRVEVIPCDLSSREDLAKLVAEVGERGVEVDVLVNDAGVGMMGMFERADVAKTTFTIDVNVTSLTLLTLAFLPHGRAQERRRHQHQLRLRARRHADVRGISGDEALRDRLHRRPLCRPRGTGVVVTQVCPGPVRTEFEQTMGNASGTKVPAFIEISEEHCARSAIRAFERRRAMVVPGITMKIVMLINALSPRFMRRAFAGLLGRIVRKKQLVSPVL